jgi:hypothetical protein
MKEMKEENKFVDELNKMECEPIFPMEKKLANWCICWGIILLGLLIWMSFTFS